MDPTTTLVSLSDLEDLVMAALRKCGLSEADARTTTDVLAGTDAFGVFTHGTKALRGYVRRLRGGGLKADAVPGIASDGPASAIVDGHSAIGMVTSVFAMLAASRDALSPGHEISKMARRLDTSSTAAAPEIALWAHLLGTS